jgi:predicted NACHT family NTPase
MEENDQVHEQDRKTDYQRKFDQDLSSFIYGTHAHLDRFREVLNALPQVDENGKSECLDAGDLYAQARTALEKLSSGLKCMEEQLPKTDEELDKRRQYLEVLLKKSQELKLTETKQHYLEAQMTQGKLYNHLVKLRGELVKAIERAKDVIQEGKRVLESRGREVGTKDPAAEPAKSYASPGKPPTGRLGMPLPERPFLAASTEDKNRLIVFPGSGIGNPPAVLSPGNLDPEKQKPNRIRSSRETPQDD